MRNRTKAQNLKSKAMHEHDLEKREELLLKAEKLSENNPIDLHFTYMALGELYYKQRNNRDDAIDLCIKYCKKDIEIFPKFEKAICKEFIRDLRKLQSSYPEGSKEFLRYEQSIKDAPNRKHGMPSFKRLAIIYEKQGKFQKAIDISKEAIKLGISDDTKSGFEGRIERLAKKRDTPPKPKKQASRETIAKHELIRKNTIEVVSNNPFPNGFMITFSKSPSSNFDKALFLAKQADFFKVTKHRGKETFQAAYLPENHLEFITLYELVGNWRSAFVFKDGKIIDRQITGQINYCYGDKLRSGDDSFCHGASYFTKNPFGCHRLMIHDGHKPWHTWIRGEDKDFIYIDKTSIREHIDNKAKIFAICPIFNYNEIINTLNELPDKINKKSSFYKEKYTSNYHEIITVDENVQREDNHRKRIDRQKSNGFFSKLLKLIGQK